MNVEVPVEIDRNIPDAVESITTFEFVLPKLEPKYKQVEVLVHVPR